MRRARLAQSGWSQSARTGVLLCSGASCPKLLILGCTITLYRTSGHRLRPTGFYRIVLVQPCLVHYTIMRPTLPCTTRTVSVLVHSSLVLSSISLIIPVTSYTDDVISRDVIYPWRHLIMAGFIWSPWTMKLYALAHSYLVHLWIRETQLLLLPRVVTPPFGCSTGLFPISTWTYLTNALASACSSIL